MGAGQQGVVWAVRPGVVGGVAARLRLRSELRPSLRLRRPATPLEYRCQGDISKSVNRVTFLLRYNIPIYDTCCTGPVTVSAKRPGWVQ